MHTRVDQLHQWLLEMDSKGFVKDEGAMQRTAHERALSDKPDQTLNFTALKLDGVAL